MKKLILCISILGMLEFACGDKVFPIMENEYTMKELQNDMKIFGRVGYVGTAAAFDWSASGFEMNVNAVGGKFTVKYSFSYASYFVVFVDRIQIARPLLSGANKTFEFDLSSGVHTIRIVKDSPISVTIGSFNCFNSVSFDGEILNKPADKGLLIEFMGASTTCGGGALGVYKDGVGATLFECTATQAFPYFICEALNADHSFVCVSGTGFVQKSGTTEGSKNLVELYPYLSGFRSTTEMYSPSRVPDVVILGPITIDLSLSNIGSYLSTMTNFVKTLRRDYGPDTKIVWIGRTGHETGLAAMNEIISSTKDPNLFAMTPLLQYVGKGSGGAFPVHPNVEEHKAIAEAVTAYLRDTVGIKNDSSNTSKINIPKIPGLSPVVVYTQAAAIGFNNVLESAKIPIVDIARRVILSKFIKEDESILVSKGMYIVTVLNAKGNQKTVKCLVG